MKRIKRNPKSSKLSNRSRKLFKRRSKIRSKRRSKIRSLKRKSKNIYDGVNNGELNDFIEKYIKVQHTDSIKSKLPSIKLLNNYEEFIGKFMKDYIDIKGVLYKELFNIIKSETIQQKELDDFITKYVNTQNINDFKSKLNLLKYLNIQFCEELMGKFIKNYNDIKNILYQELFEIVNKDQVSNQIINMNQDAKNIKTVKNNAFDILNNTQKYTLPATSILASIAILFGIRYYNKAYNYILKGDLNSLRLYATELLKDPNLINMTLDIRKNITDFFKPKSILDSKEEDTKI